MTHLHVDTTKCEGIGICEMAAPTVYEVGDDGQSHVINDHPDEREMPSVREAVAGCPKAALSIEE